MPLATRNSQLVTRILLVFLFISIFNLQSPIFNFQSASAQTITIKQHKHLYWLGVTIPSLLVTENQWKYYQKNYNLLNDENSQINHIYNTYLQFYNSARTCYKMGLSSKEDYEITINNLKRDYGKYIDIRSDWKKRQKQYLWYFGAASAVAVGSFVYAIIPTKVRIPVDLAVYPDGIELTYNF